MTLEQWQQQTGVRVYEPHGLDYLRMVRLAKVTAAGKRHGHRLASTLWDLEDYYVSQVRWGYVILKPHPVPVPDLDAARALAAIEEEDTVVLA